MPTSITDQNNVTRKINEWPNFVKDGIARARQLSWEKAASNRPNYAGVEKGVDEFTSRKLYNALAQKKPMDAGALNTILTDGVWYPERAVKRSKNKDGKCLLCEYGAQGGLQHLWWECEACKSSANLEWLALKNTKREMNSEPPSLEHRNNNQGLDFPAGNGANEEWRNSRRGHGTGYQGFH
jgi:hypothetical protein